MYMYVRVYVYYISKRFEFFKIKRYINLLCYVTVVLKYLNTRHYLPSYYVHSDNW